MEIELPLFRGPLEAFEPSRRPGTIYLGGDLHAVHPKATDRAPTSPHDDSLAEATIVIDDLEHESLWAKAVEGIWCVGLPMDRRDADPYLSLFDTEGRLRLWLILPPSRQMIGAGHLWLPFIRPLPAGQAAAGGQASRGRRDGR